MVRPGIASSLAPPALLSLLAIAPATEGHPLCFYGPDRAVSMMAEATFCPNDDPAGFCCEPDEEHDLASKFAAESPVLSAECAPLYKKVGPFQRAPLGREENPFR